MFDKHPVLFAQVLDTLDKSDKFSLAKLVDKVISSTRLVFKKNSSQAVIDLL